MTPRGLIAEAALVLTGRRRSEAGVSDDRAPSRPRPKQIVAIALVVIVVVFILQNTAESSINLLFVTVTMPVWVAFAAVLAVGVAAGYLLASRRARRR